MKLQKFFGRDKQKLAKVTPLGRDVDATQPVIDEESISAHHGSFVQPALLQSPPPSRSIPRPSTDDHWDVLQPAQPDDAVRIPSPRAHQQQFIAPVIPSRSSSLGSLVQQSNSPQIPPISPRSSSPFSITSNSISAHAAPRNQRSDDRTLRKKSPPIPGVAALGILKALEPHQELPPTQHPPDPSDDHHTSHDHGRTDRDKKDKRGFWDGMLRDRDRDKWKADKDRDRDRFDRMRDKDRRDDDLSTAELTRLIGYLTATASEDWSIVLEVCERASASEANAKDAARALRREFKYAEPKAQLAAARLWAIMLRNASDLFLQQISQRKFIEVLEDVLTSPRTQPVVRERLMEVLAAAAHITSTRSPSTGKEKEKDGFRALWCRLKPADKPETGIPFDTEDAMFSPPVVSLPRSQSQYSLETPIFAQSFPQDDLTPTPPSERPLSRNQRRYQQQRVIPLEEDIRRLFQECKIARGNADLLTQTLVYSKPDALNADLIPEFLDKCRASQELIYTQIPWASAGAERSRAEKLTRSYPRARSVTHGSQEFALANTEDAPDELTVEEELLAALLDANQALVGALKMYNDLERVAIERATEERSRKDIRMDRRHLNDSYFGEPPGAYMGSSDASPPIPSPTTIVHHPFELPTIVPSPTHPLPRIPPNLVPTTLSQSQHGLHYGSQTNTPTLLTPLHPVGPRSPAQVVTTSRTPSPDKAPARPTRHGSMDSDKERIPDTIAIERMSIRDLDASDSDDDLRTPIRPSAKALGKRRVVEDPDDGESNQSYFGKNDPYRDSTADSDSDDAGFLPRRPPVRYVYDAAAERAAQLLRDGRLVNGVH